jgi:DNA-directed RNA polymerase specialized sigma24 family protein
MNLTETDEAELLALMATQEATGEQARAAWGELYVRHRRYVYVVVSRAYGSFLGEHGTVDLVCDTFRRAYEWAGRQESAEGVRASFSTETPDSTRRLVLGWLGAIAEGLFRDRYRQEAAERKKRDLYVDDWKLSQDHEEECDHPVPQECLAAALAALSPVEAEALRVSLPWYDLETRSFAVPRGEAARLAEQLGITPEALRQRRHRAIKRIEERLRNAGYIAAGQEEPS